MVSPPKKQKNRSKFMRLAGRLKLGYYPLPPAEGDKIRNLLQFGARACERD